MEKVRLLLAAVEMENLPAPSIAPVSAVELESLASRDAGIGN